VVALLYRIASICGSAEGWMRDPVASMQVEIRIGREETIENPPSFEEVMQEIAVVILGNLVLALAAELLTRGLALG